MSNKSYEGSSIFRSSAVRATKRPVSKFPMVASADDLFATGTRKELLARILKIIDWPQHDNPTLVTALHQDFAEFIQSLPEARTGFFTAPGGLLELALERTLTGLKLVCDFFESDSEEALALQSMRQWWMYVVYSGLLLHNVGMVLADLKVEYFDVTQKSRQSWSPFAGQMPAGQYYDFHIDVNEDRDLLRAATLLLARQLMPQQAFVHIARDEILLDVWLGLLHDDVMRSGGFRFLCKRATAQVLKSHFNQSERAMQAQQGFALDGLYQTEQPLDARQLMETFVAWLERSLANDKVVMNEDRVLTDGKDVIVTEKLLRDFKQDKANRQFKNVSDKQLQEALTATEVLTRHQQEIVVGKEKTSGQALKNPFLVLPEQFRVVAPGSSNTARLTTPAALLQGFSLSTMVEAPALGRGQCNPFG